jgi:large subunit ribosomal protein L1|tara:strand:- start:5939 stop:6631 length:693 start_codon:yes stop_codon:yes gene_type:complete
MNRSNRFKENLEKINREKEYMLAKAIDLLKDQKSVGFDESVDIAVNLGVDPKHADQIVRGTISLPHGTGKKVRVLALCKGENVVAAEKSGADFVGSDDYIDKIKNGWMEIDVIIASPDMMASVGKIGRILGPRGLMPNPKSGTVSVDVAKAVKEVKSGRIEFRVDKYGIIHASVGKLSFDSEKLIDNAKALMAALMRAKPNASKGVYLKKVSITTTMGPGVKLDKNEFTA